MKFFHRTTYEEALAAEDLAYELASKVAKTNGVGVIPYRSGYCVKINLHGFWRPGLPRRVNGVRVVYDFFVRASHRGLRKK